MRKLLNLKQVAFLGLCSAVGTVAMADTTAVTTALKGIETTTTETTGATLGPVITILGIIFGAIITVSIVKRMLYGAK